VGDRVSKVSKDYSTQVPSSGFLADGALKKVLIMWIVQKQIGYTSREVLYLMLEQQQQFWTPAQSCHEDKVANWQTGKVCNGQYNEGS
jgi:hypothetical protein